MKLEESWGQTLHPQARGVRWLVVAPGLPHLLEQLEGAVYEEGVHTRALLHEQVFDLWERGRGWRVWGGRVPVPGATVAAVDASGHRDCHPWGPQGLSGPTGGPPALPH